MSTVRAEMRLLAWWAAVALTLAALAVTALRVVGLVVVLVVDTAERLEVLAAASAGVSPFSAHVVIGPGAPVPGWTPRSDP